jgi:tetratricopeptide (TPR) repeat protein
VFRYINVLLPQQRYDDALIVAETCLKLDPFNGQVANLVEQLRSFKRTSAQATPMSTGLAQLEKAVQDHPTNFQAALNLAAAYLQLQQTNRALEVFDRVLNNPKVDASAVLVIAQVYAQMGNYAKLEATLDRLVKVTPESPEAWYDLAGIKAALGRFPEAIAAAKNAIDLSNKRRASDPNARDLAAEFNQDPRFAPLRTLPEFKTLKPE